MTYMIPVTFELTTRVGKSDLLTNATSGPSSLSWLTKESATELIFSDVMTGRLMAQPRWDELMARVQPKDTIVVVWLDHFSRNFDEGVRIQADLTNRNIGIVAIKEGIDSAAAKLFRRMMMANGAYQGDSTESA